MISYQGLQNEVQVIWWTLMHLFWWLMKQNYEIMKQNDFMVKGLSNFSKTVSNGPLTIPWQSGTLRTSGYFHLDWNTIPSRHRAPICCCYRKWLWGYSPLTLMDTPIYKPTTLCQCFKVCYQFSRLSSGWEVVWGCTTSCHNIK